MLQYFGFEEEPFGITPDPRCLYLSATHREALAALDQGFSNNRGFTALIAPPGMGKTTLLFRFLEEVRETARTVFLFDMDALCEPREFVSYILRDLGISPANSSAERHEQLSAALEKENRAGRKFVVVIDEAQNLSDTVLERVRLLTNFETSRGKLMHIVLSGQPQLGDKLMQPAHVQFRQRITTIGRIQPLTAEEIVPYIDYRLKQAGYRGEPLFTQEAIYLIREASQGTPRTINNVCFNSLSLCQKLKSKQVDGSMVAKVIVDLQLVPQPRQVITPAVEVENEQPVAVEPVEQPKPRLRRLIPSTPGGIVIWAAAAVLLAATGLGVFQIVGGQSAEPRTTGDNRSTGLKAQPAPVTAPTALNASDTATVEPVSTATPIRTDAPSATASIAAYPVSQPASGAIAAPAAPRSKPSPVNATLSKPSPVVERPVAPRQEPLPMVSSTPKTTAVVPTPVATPVSEAAEPASAAKDPNPEVVKPSSGAAEKKSSPVSAPMIPTTKQVRPALIAPSTAQSTTAPKVRPALPTSQP